MWEFLSLSKGRAPPPMVIQAHACRTMHTCPETGMNMHLGTQAHRHTDRHTHKRAQNAGAHRAHPHRCTRRGLYTRHIPDESHT